jgi:hypothetical protein
VGWRSSQPSMRFMSAQSLLRMNEAPGCQNRQPAGPSCRSTGAFGLVPVGVSAVGRCGLSSLVAFAAFETNLIFSDQICAEDRDVASSTNAGSDIRMLPQPKPNTNLQFVVVFLIGLAAGAVSVAGYRFISEISSRHTGYFELPITLAEQGVIQDLVIPVRATDEIEVCICWSYQTCDQGRAPPEGGITLWFTERERRPTGLGYLAFYNRDATRLAFRGHNHCINVAGGKLPTISFRQQAPRTYTLMLVETD